MGDDGRPTHDFVSHGNGDQQGRRGAGMVCRGGAAMGTASRGGAGAGLASRGNAVAGRTAAAGYPATAKAWLDPARVVPDLAAGVGAATSCGGPAVKTDDVGPTEKREETDDENVKTGVAAAARPHVAEPRSGRFGGGRTRSGRCDVRSGGGSARSGRGGAESSHDSSLPATLATRRGRGVEDKEGGEGG
ncbi:hypothetical protein GUJ93_ZPchr0015g6814 [Zizania palustris]|uniref:Uncharacterized protein n=1 Tax=Zizania palustris TaxID=103762 RepID=A0A8J5TB21_ZIZPA|nr:hypothetical protein GUJ93_ZPchr0015g6814 [Zizania palustris]